MTVIVSSTATGYEVTAVAPSTSSQVNDAACAKLGVRVDRGATAVGFGLADQCDRLREEQEFSALDLEGDRRVGSGGRMHVDNDSRVAAARIGQSPIEWRDIRRAAAAG